MERRRRREEEGQKWEERLQENWENCLVSQHAHGSVCGVKGKAQENRQKGGLNL